MIHDLSDAERSALLGVGAQATGCGGADGYMAVAQRYGYPYVEVYDWTSSAGDWTFIVSHNGIDWRLMWQTNRWPRAGFDYSFGEPCQFVGTAEQVMNQITEELNA